MYRLLARPKGRIRGDSYFTFLLMKIFGRLSREKGSNKDWVRNG